VAATYSRTSITTYGNISVTITQEAKMSFSYPPAARLSSHCDIFTFLPNVES